MKSFLALALTWLATSSLYSQTQDFEGKIVSDVEVRYLGNKTVDADIIRSRMLTKAGQAYRVENLDKDIRSLNESGFIEDVRFLADPQGEKVKVIAEVTTRAAFGGVRFQGNQAFSDKKLAKETKLEFGGIMSDERILEAQRNIEKYYSSYGFSDVIVTHRNQATSNSGVSDLVFIIDEGSKSSVKAIRFEGNQALASNDLRKVMKTKPKGIFSWLTKSGKIDADQLERDEDAVLDSYKDAGYLRVNSSGFRRDAADKGRVNLVMPISEGQKYVVSKVGFGSMSVYQSSDLYPYLSLKNNEAYSSKKMRDDITMIRNYYGSKGYADAAVEPDIRDAGPGRVNVLYKIREGSRFKVRKVNISTVNTSGNVTKDKVIRRESSLNPGDWFNSVEMETTKSRLQNLQYFNSVEVDSSSAGSGYRDVNINVEEKMTGNIGFGFGFSTIDNLVGYVTLDQSNFDLFNPWAFSGGGQRFSMRLQAGSRRTDFSLSLIEPWFLDQKLSLGGELFYKESSYFSDYFDQTNIGGAIFLRRPLGKKGSIKLEYRLEQIELDVDKKTPAGSEFLLEDGDYLRSALNLNYIYDSRDALVNPRKGQKIDATLNFNGLGGDVNTYGFSVQGQKHWNFRWDTIFSLNGELASVDSSNNERVPIFERLFLGGANTLRGFEFRDIGPRDTPNTTNEAIGGKSLGYLTAEISIPVVDNLRFATFSDAGFVNAESFDFDPTDLYVDAGVGIRIQLPISPAPLSFDYAIPVKSPNEEADKGGQFNFRLNYQY